MRYLTYSQPPLPSYPVVLLVPSIQKEEIYNAYIASSGMAQDDVCVIQIHQAPDKKKTPAAEIREWFETELKPELEAMQTEYLLVSQADYFKVLTKSAKVEPHLGYVLDCVLGPWKVVYVPNFQAIFYDPDGVRSKIALGMQALADHRANQYQEPGKDIIHFAAYPDTLEEIEAWLEKLHAYPALTYDIETFSLKHPTAGIGTICFAWSKHEGIAFAVDFHPFRDQIRAALKRFFETYRGTLIAHSIGFDGYILVYQLFMSGILDTAGLLRGLEVMFRDWHCTKLITYLATNSCGGNRLGLKDNTQEFAGNYALEEIKDITKIPLQQLLTYNLTDGLSTWYLFEKNRPIMLADQQEDIYRNLFQPAMLDIVQMQLTGMPLNMTRVLEVDQVLLAIENEAVTGLRQSTITQAFVYQMNQAWVIKRNNELKKKRVSLADANEEFNPNSAPQLQELLFDMLGLPVLSYTDSKLPSTDADTLKALVNHTQDPAVIAFLQGMIDYKAVNKLTSSFLPAFKAATQGPDGWHYLFGNFNLGGTVSGRLSSSDPNLQNLPANVDMGLSPALMAKFGHLLVGYVKDNRLNLGKLVKSCFEAPEGWLFCGLDFDSLEDKISALTTKDPNKLKVYTDGYDGHSLRAYTYFGDQMPDIDPNSVVSINSIEKKYKPLRQESKAPTFALTYQGTFKTLMTNCGFSSEKARMIEQRYKDLYAVSIKWVSDRLDRACKDGYVTVAFGLRVRTPLLAQVIRGTRKTPHEAEAEGRTAGNAMGQSWCLLNSRAGSEFMGEVRKSEHRLSIRPSSHIHDAQYFLIRDDIETMKFANDKLVKAVQWQAHPDIEHPDVKLGGKLGIFYPNWVTEITLPNGATEEEILSAVHDHLSKVALKAA